MGTINLPIIRGDKVNDLGDYGDSIPINMVAVVKEIKGAAGYLLSHDGLTLARTGQGVDRGALYNERWGRSFRVSGQKLIEITGAGVTVIGDVIGASRSRAAYSFSSTMTVSGGFAYRYDGTTLAQMTDPDFGSPIDICWIDQYYLFTDGEYIYHTDITSETSINPLKFATSEISPDKTKAIGRTQDNLLIAFNRYTTEYFINQANENFAFSRINQKAVNCGIVSTGGWIEIKGGIYLLGGEKGEAVSVYALGAGNSVSISTREIDSVIATYTEAELSDAWLESRIDQQDKILILQLPGHTFAFNIGVAEKLGKDVAWCELRSNDTAWRASNGVYDPNLNGWYYGDKLGPNIGKLDKTTASQYGESVTSQWATPLVPMESLSIMELELDTVSGFGSTDTAVFVSTTHNGIGHSMEWSKYIAMTLDYSMRYIVRRLGRVRKNIAFKFRALNKDKINVSGLVITHDGN
jgi:hypothetical protein